MAFRWGRSSHLLTEDIIITTTTNTSILEVTILTVITTMALVAMGSITTMMRTPLPTPTVEEVVQVDPGNAAPGAGGHPVLDAEQQGRSVELSGDP